VIGNGGSARINSGRSGTRPSGRGVRDFGGSVRGSLSEDMDRMRKAAEWGSWAEDYVSERWGWKGGVVVTVVALAVLALIFYPLWSTW
jgi:hypothetical protein